MEALQIFYALAIGVGFGGLMFAVTYHLFTAIRKGRHRGRALSMSATRPATAT